jgi:hypothetical protein
LEQHVCGGFYDGLVISAFAWGARRAEEIKIGVVDGELAESAPAVRALKKIERSFTARPGAQKNGVSGQDTSFLPEKEGKPCRKRTGATRNVIWPMLIANTSESTANEGRSQPAPE